MLQNWIKKHENLWYVLISYLIISIVTLIFVIFKIHFISQGNVTISNLFLWLLYIFSPTISAILSTYIAGGKMALTKYFRGYTIWRLHFGWYMAALILLVLPLAVGLVIFLTGNSQGSLVNQSMGTVIYLVVFGLFSGPISEEGGWRGLLLPKLESKYNALVSSLILGIVWFVWHIPLFFISGTSQNDMLQYGIPSAIFGSSIYFVLVMSISIILTWLYNNTKGSLIITILAHFCFNFGSTLAIQILGILSANSYNIIGGILGVIYLLFIFIYFGFRKFSRKPDNEMPYKKEN